MNKTVERVAVVIEDDADAREVIETILIEAGFTVKSAATGAQGLVLVAACHPTLTTLDVNVPGMDGFETLKHLRLISATRIIMISARFDEIDVVRGLGAGADDFIAQPFHAGELRARIDAVLRRGAATVAGGAGAAPVADDLAANGRLHHDGLSVDPAHRMVTVEGLPVTMTRSEFALLERLMQPGRRVHTTAELVLELRGERYVTSGLVTYADKRSLEVHVANVRRKIGHTVAGTDRVETVRGVGYRLRAAAP